MRKPIKLTNTSGGVISANFGDGSLTQQVPFRRLNQSIQTDIDNGSYVKDTPFASPDGKFTSVFDEAEYIQPPQPDWAQDDPKQPDFIHNKQIAEQYRPITVDGEEFLGEERETGALDVIGKGGIIITTEGNQLQFSVEDYVEGDAIDIKQNEDGKREVSVEPDSLGDKHISALSIGKLT